MGQHFQRIYRNIHFDSLKEWYDGYKLSENEIYNPLSVISAILMNGGRIPVEIANYQNDMTTFADKDDILTLLIHLGYLGFDADSKCAFIPNREILDEFRASTRTRSWTATLKALQNGTCLIQCRYDYSFRVKYK